MKKVYFKLLENVIQTPLLPIYIKYVIYNVFIW